MPKAIGNLKVCSKCRRELPLDAYHLNRGRSDGLAHRCKQCTINVAALPASKQRLRDWKKQYYSLPENKIKRREYERERRKHQRPAGVNDYIYVAILEEQPAAVLVKIGRTRDVVLRQQNLKVHYQCPSIKIKAARKFHDALGAEMDHHRKYAPYHVELDPLRRTELFLLPRPVYDALVADLSCDVPPASRR